MGKQTVRVAKKQIKLHGRIKAETIRKLLDLGFIPTLTETPKP